MALCYLVFNEDTPPSESANKRYSKIHLETRKYIMKNANVRYEWLNDVNLHIFHDMIPIVIAIS